MKARIPPIMTKKQSQIMYEKAAYDTAKSVIGAVLYVLHLRKWHGDRIQKFYADILSILEMPPILGKSLNDYDVRAFLAEKYDIDFSKIKIQFNVVPEEKMKKIAQIRREEGIK